MASSSARLLEGRRASGDAARSSARSWRPSPRSQSTMSGSRWTEPLSRRTVRNSRERPGEVTLAVGHHAQRLAGRRHATGTAHRRLGVRHGAVEVVGLEQGRHHDEVLGDALGVLLAQGPQLLVDRAVELLAGHPVRDAGSGSLGPFGASRLPPRCLAVIGGPAAVTPRVGVPAAGLPPAPPRRRATVTPAAAARPRSRGDRPRLGRRSTCAVGTVATRCRRTVTRAVRRTPPGSRLGAGPLGGRTATRRGVRRRAPPAPAAPGCTRPCAGHRR